VASPAAEAAQQASLQRAEARAADAAGAVAVAPSPAGTGLVVPPPSPLPPSPTHRHRDHGFGDRGSPGGFIASGWHDHRSHARHPAGAGGGIGDATPSATPSATQSLPTPPVAHRLHRHYHQRDLSRGGFSESHSHVADEDLRALMTAWTLMCEEAEEWVANAQSDALLGAAGGGGGGADALPPRAPPLQPFVPRARGSSGSGAASTLQAASLEAAAAAAAAEVAAAESAEGAVAGESSPAVAAAGTAPPQGPAAADVTAGGAGDTLVTVALEPAAGGGGSPAHLRGRLGSAESATSEGGSSTDSAGAGPHTTVVAGGGGGPADGRIHPSDPLDAAVAEALYARPTLARFAQKAMHRLTRRRLVADFPFESAVKVAGRVFGDADAASLGQPTPLVGAAAAGSPPARGRAGLPSPPPAALRPQPRAAGIGSGGGVSHDRKKTVSFVPSGGGGGGRSASPAGGGGGSGGGPPAGPLHIRSVSGRPVDVGSLTLYLKGAPEAVLARCRHVHVNATRLPLTDATRSDLAAALEEAAASGLRMVGYARKHLRGAALRECLQQQQPAAVTAAAAAATAGGDDAPVVPSFSRSLLTDCDDAELLGIFGFEDPVRDDAADAVALAQGAGIRVVMVTGDHPRTATAVAKRVGILRGDAADDRGVSPAAAGAHTAVSIASADAAKAGTRGRGGGDGSNLPPPVTLARSVSAAHARAVAPAAPPAADIAFAARGTPRGSGGYVVLRDGASDEPPQPLASMPAAAAAPPPSDASGFTAANVHVVNCSRASSLADSAIGSSATPAASTDAGDAGDVVPSALAWAASTAAAGALVYARATPLDKRALVRAYQAGGHVVAVTGDGVNDAPALAAAEVGVAVRDATDVAREACALLVAGNADLRAVVGAVGEGRRLAANLAAALEYYLAVKLFLPILFIAATAWRGFPLSPLQVVVMELPLDIGASTAFVMEPAEAGTMARPPPPRGAPFFSAGRLARILAATASATACVLGAYAYGIVHRAPAGDAASLAGARSCAFLAWLLCHVSLALNMRTQAQPVLASKSLGANPTFTLWAVVVFAVAVAAGASPPLAAAFQITPLDRSEWAVVGGLVVGCTWWMEAAKWAAVGARAVAARRPRVAAAGAAASALVRRHARVPSYLGPPPVTPALAFHYHRLSSGSSTEETAGATAAAATSAGATAGAERRGTPTAHRMQPPAAISASGGGGGGGGVCVGATPLPAALYWHRRRRRRHTRLIPSSLGAYRRSRSTPAAPPSAGLTRGGDNAASAAAATAPAAAAAAVMMEVVPVGAAQLHLQQQQVAAALPPLHPGRSNRSSGRSSSSGGGGVPLLTRQPAVRDLRALAATPTPTPESPGTAHSGGGSVVAAASVADV
jgi:magnesium-transporting ATPase (P-type)